MTDIETIRQTLAPLGGRFTVEVLPECGSTNTVLKKRASELPDRYTLVALHQTGGRGRLGRSFFSPEGTGLYLSVLLRPALAAEDAPLITPAAAVAVCRAIESLTERPAQIKWVNDIHMDGKKVCGILTEASFDPEGGKLAHAVLGVGINVSEPAGGFPAELSEIAGAVFPCDAEDQRGPLAAAFLRELDGVLQSLPDRAFVEEYRTRSFLIGQDILVLRDGGSVPARAVGIDDRCGLLVEYPDGREETLSSGEVSVRPRGCRP